MKIYLLIVGIVILASCRDQKKTNRGITEDSKAVVSTSTDTVKSGSQDQKYVETLTWVDDFKNFRMALYNKDVIKLKTYFAFPLNVDTTYIWTAITTVSSHNEIPKLADPKLLYENDFEKYYMDIFKKDFINSILKIKSEKLYKDGTVSTKTFKGGDKDYLMEVSVSDDHQNLHFNLAYSNGKLEDSEDYGEYNLIYVFKIINGKRLRFEKIILAG